VDAHKPAWSKRHRAVIDPEQPLEEVLVGLRDGGDEGIACLQENASVLNFS
jgi:hypothetical protein